MNVSAALAIKTGGFEGSGSGKYINTDKFKESDLNFFIQVKVTNQEHIGSDYTDFQDYHVERVRFTDVYGVGCAFPSRRQAWLTAVGYLHFRLGRRWRV